MDEDKKLSSGMTKQKEIDLFSTKNYSSNSFLFDLKNLNVISQSFYLNY